MRGRILHLSDLHAGAHDDRREEIEEAARLLARQVEPELVVASGDLTHRNRQGEHARAAAFLRSLGAPVVAVPGNHDLPALPPARLLRPFARFLEVWPEIEPDYRSDALAVHGLNSVRPWKYQRGAVGDAQLARATAALRDADAALRVIVLHHHLATPPWRTGKRTVPRRTAVLDAAAAAGAELVVGGHTHQGIVVERREFLVPQRGGRALVLAGVPGLGRPRPGRQAEAAGVNVYDADPAVLRARSYAWTDGGFELVADRRFPRCLGALGC